jgi:hypothetical protein
MQAGAFVRDASFFRDRHHDGGLGQLGSGMGSMGGMGMGMGGMGSSSQGLSDSHQSQSSAVIGLQLAGLAARNGRTRQIRNAAVDSIMVSSSGKQRQTTGSLLAAGNTLLRLLNVCRAREVSSGICVLYHVLARSDEILQDHPDDDDDHNNREHALAIQAIAHAYLSAVAAMFSVDELEMRLSETGAPSMSLDLSTFTLSVPVQPQEKKQKKEKKEKKEKASSSSSKKQQQRKPLSFAPLDFSKLSRPEAVRMLMASDSFRSEFRSYFGAASAQLSDLDATGGLAQELQNDELDDVDAEAASMVTSVGGVSGEDETDQLLEKLLNREYAAQSGPRRNEDEERLISDSMAIPLQQHSVAKPASLAGLFPVEDESESSSSELDEASVDVDDEGILELPSAVEFRELTIPNRDFTRLDTDDLPEAPDAGYYAALAAVSVQNRSEAATNMQDVMRVTEHLLRLRDERSALTRTPQQTTSLAVPTGILS